MPEAAAILEELQLRQARMQPLLDLLIEALGHHLGSQAHCRLLQQLIDRLSLGEVLSPPAVKEFRKLLQ